MSADAERDELRPLGAEGARSHGQRNCVWRSHAPTAHPAAPRGAEGGGLGRAARRRHRRVSSRKPANYRLKFAVCQFQTAKICETGKSTRESEPKEMKPSSRPHSGARLRGRRIGSIGSRQQRRRGPGQGPVAMPLDGVREKLERGAMVTDVGCGHGGFGARSAADFFN